MTTGFIQTSPSEKTPAVPYDFRHAMCFGETGCGKTSCFILPNIKERINQKHGVFILDYKGTLHPQVKAIAHEERRLKDVVEIGTPWGQAVNILIGTSKSLFLEGLELLCGEENDKFWSTSSLNMIGTLYETLMLSSHLVNIGESVGMDIEMSLPFRVQTMIEATRDAGSMKHFCDKIAQLTSKCTEQDLARVATRLDPPTLILLERYRKLLDEKCERIKTFYKNIPPEHPASGNGGVLFQMQNLLGTFGGPGLNGEDELLSLLEKGKIVLFRSDGLPKRLNEVVMHILYTRLAKRTNTTRPISLIIDEFQRSITKESVPFVDVFREKKVELIGAVQNTELLDIAIGENGTRAFLGNIVHQYTFAKEVFTYTYHQKLFTGVPLFFDQKTLNDVQLSWQSALSAHVSPPKDWVYEDVLDEHTCQIRNTQTGEVKLHFLLKRNKGEMLLARQKLYELTSRGRKLYKQAS